MIIQNKIKAAVVGLGNMGENHIRTYINMHDVELVGISDIDQAKGLIKSKQYNIESFSSYVDMVDQIKPDLVSVCVPTSLHYLVAKECITRGINMLIEKPITGKFEEAEKLIRSAKQRGIIFLVGHTERFNPAVVKVKEIINKGAIGDIITIIARRVGGLPPQIKDVDIAVDLAIHDIDIANYLIGELPRKITENKQISHTKDRYDSVEFFLKYKKATAFVQSNWITPVKIRKLTITGTKGYLEMDYLKQHINFYKSNVNKFKNNVKDYSDYVLRFSNPEKIHVEVGKKEPLKEELQYLINAIRDKKIIDNQFAVDALKISLS